MRRLIIQYKSSSARIYKFKNHASSVGTLLQRREGQVDSLSGKKCPLWSDTISCWIGGREYKSPIHFYASIGYHSFLSQSHGGSHTREMKQDAEDIRQCLGETDKDAIDRVGALFIEVDQAAKKFQSLTGIKCPEGCGECCRNSRVETTVIEMLPLALELWSQNTAEYWMTRIHETLDDPKCIFYETQSGSATRGRCTVYPQRPLICRLFGFFTVRNKYGKYVFGSCRVIKQEYPEVYANAVRMLDEINHPSVCTDYSIRIIGMDSMLGNRMLPINRAASLALEKIGYRLEHIANNRPVRTAAPPGGTSENPLLPKR